jgi:hypothetical protein
MILLEPANTITHYHGEIKRRTISLTGVFGNYADWLPYPAECAESSMPRGAPSAHGLQTRIFASLERAKISERTLAGLAKARSEGRVGGRPKVEDDAATMKTYRKLKARGLL